MAYEYRLGANTALAGTVATSGTTAVVGSGTAFDTALQAGDYLTIGAETRIVATVTDGTHLTVTVAYTPTASGLSAARVRLANLETALGLPAPHGLFTAYSQPIGLGNGLVRGAGWQTAEWQWGFISRAHRDLLRAYCPGASASVYIKTRTNDSADAFAIYAAKMLWPQQEDPQAGRRLEFSLKFQGLVLWP